MKLGDCREGDRLPSRVVKLTNEMVARYAHASTDYNPIHLSEERARAAGFPTAIAHGLHSMAIATKLVTDWVGDPRMLVSATATFRTPVLVGETLEFSGLVSRIDESGGTVDVELTAVMIRDGVEVQALAAHAVLARTATTDDILPSPDAVG